MGAMVFEYLIAADIGNIVVRQRGIAIIPTEPKHSFDRQGCGRIIHLFYFLK